MQPLFTEGPALRIAQRRRRHSRSAEKRSLSLCALTDSNTKLPGYFLDKSPGGAYIAAGKNVRFQPGDTVRIAWSSYAVDATVVRATEQAANILYGLRFHQAVDELTADVPGLWARSLVVLGVIVLGFLIVFLKTRNIVSFWYQPLLQVYSLGAAFYVLSRVIISLFYRSPKDAGIIKSVSIIIAAKNEEENIAETVRRCFQVHYPEDQLEVIVIDDGSTDGTWQALEDLHRQLPHFRAFRFDKNRGKRHGMALGVEKASGEILVFIDSDTFIDNEGLYRLIQPFADPKVGAVAGHTLVIVEPDNIISKMEAIRYFVSQRIMKASESVFNAVGCCPGPFSAYRRDAVLKVLPQWRQQSFLGKEATFGDDRSLTNFILRHYRVLYHSGAVCATYVPRRWKTFFIQQLRWKKSWVRETTIASRFMYKKDPIAAISYYMSVVITLVSPLIALRALFYLPLRYGTFSYLPYLLGLMLVYSLFGLMYQYYRRSPRWYYGLIFACLYVSILCFQNYYAILTVRRNHWGTR